MSKTKSKSQWKEKLLEWQASGKSARAWCREHKIPVTTFYGWRKRIKKIPDSQNQTIPKPFSQSLESPAFIELKNKKPSDSGIILDCSGVKIHLMAEFDPLTLKQCIECLRGAPC